MSNHVIYAAPRLVEDPADCYFYHTMDLPGHGTVTGEWDLRGREAAYLGNVDFQGKRVLEVGTASGHLCSCKLRRIFLYVSTRAPKNTR